MQHTIGMRIVRDKTAGVIIDVQDRLLPHIFEGERVLQKISTLVQGLETLGVPLIVTEQYPKGLGPTDERLMSIFSTPPEPVIKGSFSCCDDAIFERHLHENQREIVLIAGIEAHVCLLQTTIDLIDHEYVPVVVADATSSRNPRDAEIALRRMEQAGAVLTTVESVLLELTRFSGTDEFKTISRLIK
jgi:nicotinamidase-related amidase